MEVRVQKLEEEIERIKERNRRVEAEKAWETSIFRVVSIILLTYAVIVVVMWSIEVQRPFVDAIIPTVGFTLSTLTLPPIKRWWISHRQRS